MLRGKGAGISRVDVAQASFRFYISLLPGWRVGFKTGLMLPVIHLEEHHLLPSAPLIAVEKIWQTGLVLMWSCTMEFQAVLIILRQSKWQSATALGMNQGCALNEVMGCVMSALFLLKTGRGSWPTTVSGFVNWHLTSTGLRALACLSNYNIISHFAVHNIDCCSLASLRNILWKNENTRSNF